MAEPATTAAPETKAPNEEKKKPLKGIWTAADGGPGPADWRKQKGI